MWLWLCLVGCVVSPNPFPADFVFGVATSSYQIEGAWDTDGRGPSIWDDFTHSGHSFQKATGDVTVDHYHRFKEDIQLMVTLGVKYYRFSISWSRLIPEGRGLVNEEGVAFYNRLLDELHSHHITPFVTLYHWDLPSGLHRRYNGWLSEEIIHDFTDYANLCFQRFGDRVHNWITINEPLVVTELGYRVGVFAPGRCSDRALCGSGNSTVEPYIVGHNLLLAHASAVAAFRQSSAQGGVIGITLNIDWLEPRTDRYVDKDAAERAMLFSAGWWADPIYKGDYPSAMRSRLGSRLPTFTPEQRKSLKGSSDFFGLNHYTSKYITDAPCPDNGTWYQADACVSVHETSTDGRLIGGRVASPWLLVVPRGIREVLKWVYSRYGAPIYITENGVSDEGDGPGMLKDDGRVFYYRDYLANVHAAVQDGVEVRGYFAWSLLDNFEWADGFAKRFGLVYVDFDTLTRTPKASYQWFKEYLTPLHDGTNPGLKGEVSRLALPVVIIIAVLVVAGVVVMWWTRREVLNHHV